MRKQKPSIWHIVNAVIVLLLPSFGRPDGLREVGRCFNRDHSVCEMGLGGCKGADICSLSAKCQSLCQITSRMSYPFLAMTLWSGD